MAQVRRIVHEAVNKFGGTCPMEEVRALCPGLTETQVFLAIDEMSRCGELRLLRDTEGTYFVRTNQVVTQTTSSSFTAS